MLNIDQGHDDQFQYLYQTYYKLVYGTAFRIVKNKEDSEEITQDSFRITFKNMAKMKDTNHFRNYLLRVAYNDSLKKRLKKILQGIVYFLRLLMKRLVLTKTALAKHLRVYSSLKC